MSSSDDSYDFEAYCIEFYEEGGGPPLIKKKSRLLAATVQNDVETLRELLDDPKWYNVRDKYGYNLLQIAILRENKEVFEYILSIEDYPLETVSSEGQTALEISLTGFVSNDIFLDGRFAIDLIKKGANIDRTCYEGNTLLHCAFERDLIPVAKLLIERGADLDERNDDGDTALHICCFWCSDANVNEGVAMLLAYGADPSIHDSAGFTAFDLIMMKKGDIQVVQEMLFYYTFDQYTQYEIPAHVLLMVGESCPQLFNQMIANIAKVTYKDELHSYCSLLFKLEAHILQVLISQFDYVIKEVLSRSPRYVFRASKTVCCENLYVLVESKLNTEVVSFLSNMKCTLISNILESTMSETVKTELVCFLLSYGIDIYEIHLQTVYQKFGYSHLFKILLHMDIQKQKDVTDLDCMPLLIYDVSADVREFIENPIFCSVNDLMELLSYFALPELKHFCCDSGLFEGFEDFVKKFRNQPSVPLLVELARNVFRRYFITKFQIKNSRQFYTMLKLLPISSVHEKIITFERRLY